jgi:hypothetical protein
MNGTSTRGAPFRKLLYLSSTQADGCRTILAAALAHMLVDSEYQDKFDCTLRKQSTVVIGVALSTGPALKGATA